VSDSVERWWEPRRENEPTPEFLGRVLDQLGAAGLAANARAFHYDDYLCPDHLDAGDNIHRLIAEVEEWSVANRHPRRARAVMTAARYGEFDGTRAESEAWARSADGQAAFTELLGDTYKEGRPDA
jgi:hypothetical protein